MNFIVTERQTTQQLIDATPSAGCLDADAGALAGAFDS